MSIDHARDPRVTLMRDKFFTMRPKPLERWVWQQGLPASAERVYWYHWDLGARNGTWCSQVPLRLVARDCCLDPATVTRAYQLLKRLALVRRDDPGRDPNHAFRQEVAVTEVRLPRDLVTGLGREPNRCATRSASVAAPAPLTVLPENSRVAEPIATSPTRDESRAVFAKLSAGERTRFATSSSHRRTTIEFDADTRLMPTDRAHVLATLESLSRARPQGVPREAGERISRGEPRGPRRLGALELLRVQKGLRVLAAACAELPLPALFGEVVYAVEEGALLKFAVPLALNIALKKVREGLWSSPHRMPPDWSLRRALPETCSAAGGI